MIALSVTLWKESVSKGVSDSVQHGGRRVYARVIALSGTMWEESVSGGVKVIQCNTVGGKCACV